LWLADVTATTNTKLQATTDYRLGQGRRGHYIAGGAQIGDTVHITELLCKEAFFSP
jgi:hypothetical protein